MRHHNWIGKMTKPRIRIRKHGMEDNLYLSRQGTWVPWSKAATFVSDERAVAFAKKCGIGETKFGTFTHKCRFGKP